MAARSERTRVATAMPAPCMKSETAPMYDSIIPFCSAGIENRSIATEKGGEINSHNIPIARGPFEEYKEKPFINDVSSLGGGGLAEILTKRREVA